MSGSAAYHLDTRGENLLALGAWAAGALLLAVPALWRPVARAVSEIGRRVGPETAYRVSLRGLNSLSTAIHDIEVRDLRTRVAAVLVPAGVLVAAAILAPPAGAPSYTFGAIGTHDIPLALALGLVAVAGLAAAFPRGHLMLVLVVSSVGFSLALVYTFFGAPDVALVAVLVETVLALLFLAVLRLVPRDVLRREAELQLGARRRRRNVAVGVLSGGFAFVVAWAALSRPSPEGVAGELLRRTPDAHAKDAVTAILADFRGLDTLVEISVIAVALIGIATLVGRARPG